MMFVMDTTWNCEFSFYLGLSLLFCIDRDLINEYDYSSTSDLIQWINLLWYD